MAENEDEEFGEFLQGPTPHIGTQQLDEKNLLTVFENSIETETIVHDLHVFNKEEEDYKKEAQILGNFKSPSVQLADSSYCDVFSTHSVNPIISDVLSTHLVDPFTHDVMSHPSVESNNSNAPFVQNVDPIKADEPLIQLLEPIDVDVSFARFIDPINSDEKSHQTAESSNFYALSPQFVGPSNFDAQFTQSDESIKDDEPFSQLVDLSNSDVPLPQIVDPVNLDVLFPDIVESSSSGVLSHLSKPCISDVLPSQLVETSISNVPLIQLFDPLYARTPFTRRDNPVSTDVLSSLLAGTIISDLLSPQLVEPVISDLLSPQHVDPVISDLLSPQLVEPVISDLLSPQLVDPVISDLLSPQLVEPNVSNEPLIQNVDLLNADEPLIKLVDAVNVGVVFNKLVEPFKSDVLTPQLVEPVSSDVLSPQLVEPVKSHVSLHQLVEPNISNDPLIQRVDPINAREPPFQLLALLHADVTSIQHDEHVCSDSQVKFTADLTNTETASCPGSDEPKSYNILDTKSLFDNQGVSDAENCADIQLFSKYPATDDKCNPFVGPMPRVSDVTSQCWTETRAEGADRCIHEWGRCLTSCWQVVSEANTFLGSIESSSICNEVLKSTQGLQYVSGLLEVYRIICRLATSMRSTAISTTKLEQTLKSIDIAWNNLTAFLAGASLFTKQDSLVFTHCMLESDLEDSDNLACGVCLLSVDPAPFTACCDEETKSGKLTYSGRQYHTSCANFWVNCVDQTLPVLTLSNLL